MYFEALTPLLNLLFATTIFGAVEAIILKLLKEAAETIEKLFLSVFGVSAGIGYLWYLSFVLLP